MYAYSWQVKCKLLEGRCYLEKRIVHSSICTYVCVSRSDMPDSLRPYGLQPARLLCPWDSPGKNTGVGCHFLLQGIFPTQGSNLGLLLCRQILYLLSHQGNPFITSYSINISACWGYQKLHKYVTCYGLLHLLFGVFISSAEVNFYSNTIYSIYFAMFQIWDFQLR